tara:strand:+ start:343 stop:981 length:639 start_codon:yes stop_codon:yes gene_type:complete
MFGALHFHAAGFVGSLVLSEGADSVTVTPNATDGVWSVLSQLATAATSGCASTYTFSVTNAGIVSISSTGTFNLAMTAETQAICGFSAASFSSVSSVSSTAAPATSFTPYTDGDGVLLLGNLRAPMSEGFQVFDGGHWANTPGTGLKFPHLSFSCLRSVLEDFLDVTQLIGTPSKVDIMINGSPSTFFLGNIRVSEQDPIDGWTRVNLEVCQ